MEYLNWSSRSGEIGRPHDKKLCHATLKFITNVLTVLWYFKRWQNLRTVICANFGTFATLIESNSTEKSLKNWQEKLEKGGKITYMDFTARLKSCSTKTKFDNLFKTNRKLAQDFWARFATFWGILSFKLKKLFENYHCSSWESFNKNFTERMVIFEQLFQFER